MLPSTNHRTQFCNQQAQREKEIGMNFLGRNWLICFFVSFLFSLFRIVWEYGIFMSLGIPLKLQKRYRLHWWNKLEIKCYKIERGRQSKFEKSVPYDMTPYFENDRSVKCQWLFLWLPSSSETLDRRVKKGWRNFVPTFSLVRFSDKNQTQKVVHSSLLKRRNCTVQMEHAE